MVIILPNQLMKLFEHMVFKFLADVIFDPKRTINFKTHSPNPPLGCSGMEHHQIPLMGIFNREGITGTSVEPTGALCQLQ